MRQVPNYLLIGNGRVARHFRHYFSLLNIPYTHWYRGLALSELKQHAESATHILLLISDTQIEPFILQHLKNIKATLIHFSGSLITDHAYGAHPLMTFHENLYALEQYQAIPFIIDEDAPAFAALLPGLNHPHLRLAKQLKPKYHALCVLSGNFTCMLWQKLFADFSDELKIPAEFAHPYLAQQMQNLMRHPQASLTGPLTRNDQTTIQNNLAALKDDPFQEIYQSFVSCYEKITRNN